MESLAATFTPGFMALEATPHDETAPVYERAMPAIRRWRIPHAAQVTERPARTRFSGGKDDSVSPKV